MKVLLINSVCGTGSTGRIVTDLHDVIIESGNDARIAFGVGSVNRVDPEHTFCFANRCDYYVHNLMSKITDRAGFYSKRNTMKLVEFIKEYKPDIIHLHNLHGYYLNVKILFNFLKEYDKPVVWTLHDCWAFTGHCAYFSRSDCDKWMTECCRCHEKKSYPTSYVFNCARKNFIQKKELFTSIKNMSILTPSIWLKNMVEKSFLKKYPVIAVGNGIDLDDFKPVTSDFRERYNLKGKKILLAVANVWAERKGIYDYIQLSKLIDNSCKLVLVGMTDHQIKNMPNNILALPKTKSIKELVQIYTASDVLLNLSTEETFGMTTVEALACGTPVITYNKTAVPEPVTKNNGYVVEQGDVKQIYNLIKDFPDFDVKELRKSICKYDKNLIYQGMLSIYRSIL